MTRLASVLLAIALLAGCDTDALDVPPAVFVGSQGAGEAGSVTRYDLATGDVVSAAVPVDGRVQNLKVRGGRLYVFLLFDDSRETTRGRIDVVDLETGERTWQIDVSAPHDWAVVEGTAYVSNHYASSVTPVYLATGQRGRTVQVGPAPSGVAAAGHRVYVANSAAQSVSVLSSVNDVVVETIDVGCESPRALLADAEDEVWVVCTGRSDATAAVDGEVVVLDGHTGNVVTRLPLGAPAGLEPLGAGAAIDRERGEVTVVVGQTLRRFDTRTNAASGEVAVPGAPVSSIAVDEASGRLYLGRLTADGAGDIVTVHERDGAEIDRFSVGAVPTAIALTGE